MRKPLVFAEIIASDQCHKPFEDAVPVAADQDVLSIARAVGIRRCYARQRTAARFADVAETIVFRNKALHHPENRFVQGDVDALPFAAVAAAVIECQQSPDNRVQSGK